MSNTIKMLPFLANKIETQVKRSQNVNREKQNKDWAQSKYGHFWPRTSKQRSSNVETQIEHCQKMPNFDQESRHILPAQSNYTQLWSRKRKPKSSRVKTKVKDSRSMPILPKNFKTYESKYDQLSLKQSKHTSTIVETCTILIKKVKTHVEHSQIIPNYDREKQNLSRA